MELGTVPERLLYVRSRRCMFDNLPKLAGIPPVNWFSAAIRTAREERFPNDEGIAPDKLF